MLQSGLDSKIYNQNKSLDEINNSQNTQVVIQSSEDVSVLIGNDGDININIGHREKENIFNHLNKSFEFVDMNKDGTLDKNELVNYLNQNGNNLSPELLKQLGSAIGNIDKLMFGSVDPGAAAWFGLTKQDLKENGDKVHQGYDITTISNGLQKQIENERATSVATYGGNFDNYTRFMQILANLAPHLFNYVRNENQNVSQNQILIQII